MRKKAFSLIEILIAMALLSAIAMYTYKNYLNLDGVTSKLNSTKIKADINLITSIVIKCRDISGQFPKNIDSSDSNGSLLRELECKSSTPYALDGYKDSFIPKLESEFSDWVAYEVAGTFYIQTSADKSTPYANTLKNIADTYPTSQVLLETTTLADKDILRFYIYK